MIEVGYAVRDLALLIESKCAKVIKKWKDRHLTTIYFNIFVDKRLSNWFFIYFNSDCLEFTWRNVTD